MNLTNVCRLCLCSDDLEPIFTDEQDHETYSKVLYNVTRVEIHYDDGLPQDICINCLNNVEKTKDFQEMCQNTEYKLIEGIGENKHKNKCIIKYKISIENTESSNMKTEYDDDIIKNEADLDNEPLLQAENYQTINDSTKINNLEEADEVVESKTELTEIMIINKYDAENVKNFTDSDDDKPLKTLLDMKNSNNIVEAKNTDLDFNYKNIENGNTRSNFDTDISETEKNKAFKQSAASADWKSVVPDLPYELINDPISKKVTKVYCKLCSRELSIRSIASHIAKMHPGADSRKVKCELCDSYVMAEKLNRHNIMMHGNESFMCRYCKLQFDLKEKLIDHVKGCIEKKRERKANDSGRELLKCDICNKMMQKASLRMHKAVKHAGLKPVCQHCGKSFGNKFRLNEHYRAKHGYEKFKCNTCDFTSAGVMAMRNHERRHRGEKPFVCETCGVKFHASYLLTQHRQSHRTEKLIKCDLCPASFKANNSLHMHKLTCHSNSTYMCTLCCRSYKCRHYAVKHLRHVHRYNGPTPPLVVVTKDDVVTITKN